jgi:hypothetical protein
MSQRILVAIDPGKRPDDPLALGVRLARLASAPLEVVSVFLTVPLEPDDKFIQEAARRRKHSFAKSPVASKARALPTCARWAPSPGPVASRG